MSDLDRKPEDRFFRRAALFLHLLGIHCLLFIALNEPHHKKPLFFECPNKYVSRHAQPHRLANLDISDMETSGIRLYNLQNS